MRLYATACHLHVMVQPTGRVSALFLSYESWICFFHCDGARGANGLMTRGMFFGCFWYVALLQGIIVWLVLPNHVGTIHPRTLSFHELQRQFQVLN